ncbi:hypothetical protein MN0502_08140 [Arthrobacter sp. MN05-02]|nr:hypothetical protein MN0502_08140 [Arthrobacter sp. MN05-02]
MQQLDVGRLAREGHRGAGDTPAGLDRGPSVDEEDGAAVLTEEPHAGQYLMHRRDGAVDGELHRAPEVGRRRLEDGPHEVLLRQGAVLQYLDGAECLGGGLQGGGDGFGVPDVRRETARSDAFPAEVLGEGVHLALAPGDEGHGEAFRSETPCHSGSEAASCSDDRESCHTPCKNPGGCIIPTGADLLSAVSRGWCAG